MMISPDNTSQSNSEWKQIPLSEILIEYNEKSKKDNTYEHVSLTKEGVVPKSDRYDRDFLVKTEEKNYRVTHLNDICYNPANLKFGVICRNKYKDAIFSPIYVTFKVAPGYDPRFIEYLVTRKDFINYALKFQEGTVYERMAVSPEDLLTISVRVPALDEQKRIADLFEKIDALILTVENEKNTLVKQKYSVAEKLISVDHEDTVAYNMGEICSINPKTEKLKNNFYYIDLGCVDHGVLLETNNIDIDNAPSRAQRVLKNDDILFQSVRPYNMGHLHFKMQNNDNEQYVASTGFLQLRANDKIDSDYLYHLLFTENFNYEVISRCTGSNYPAINVDSFSEIVVNIPSKDKQSRISSLLNAYEKLINSAQEKIDNLLIIKDGLLQELYMEEE